MTYTPRPIETTSVVLPVELDRLIEQLAANNHDHWARKRFSEGWTYGPSRNDERKTHPDLVPYVELSESEKDYDRVTVVEALKAIIALGYTIDKR